MNVATLTPLPLNALKIRMETILDLPNLEWEEWDLHLSTNGKSLKHLTIRVNDVPIHQMEYQDGDTNHQNSIKGMLHFIEDCSITAAMYRLRQMMPDYIIYAHRVNTYDYIFIRTTAHWFMLRHVYPYWILQIMVNYNFVSDIYYVRNPQTFLSYLDTEKYMTIAVLTDTHDGIKKRII